MSGYGYKILGKHGAEWWDHEKRERFLDPIAERQYELYWNQDQSHEENVERIMRVATEIGEQAGLGPESVRKFAGHWTAGRVQVEMSRGVSLPGFLRKKSWGGRPPELYDIEAEAERVAERRERDRQRKAKKRAEQLEQYPPSKPSQRQCPNCREFFTPERDTAIYCSTKCRVGVNRKIKRGMAMCKSKFCRALFEPQNDHDYCSVHCRELQEKHEATMKEFED